MLLKKLSVDLLIQKKNLAFLLAIFELMKIKVGNPGKKSKITLISKKIGNSIVLNFLPLLIVCPFIYLFVCLFIHLLFFFIHFIFLFSSIFFSTTSKNKEKWGEEQDVVKLIICTWHVYLNDDARYTPNNLHCNLSKPKHASGEAGNRLKRGRNNNVVVWNALHEIRTRRILREKADCKQSINWQRFWTSINPLANAYVIP